MKYLYKKEFDEKIGLLWIIPLFMILLGITNLLTENRITLLLISLIIFLIFTIIETIYPPKEYIILIDENGQKTKKYIKDKKQLNGERK